MNEKIYLTTPVGRFVMGDAFQGSDRDMSGRPRLNKDGTPKTIWFMGLAIPKTDPGFPELWNQINAVAQRDFPSGEWQRPGFAWKVVDGDGTNQDGKAYPDYCKGHYILRMSSGFPPDVFNNANPPAQIVDRTQIKRGDYVRAYISLCGNDDRQRPGIYVNQQMIQLVGYGEAIQVGPSAAEVFTTPAALPPGASATPIATGAMPVAPGNPAVPTTAPAPGMPVAGQMAAPAPGMPAPAPGMPGQVPGAYAAPAAPMAAPVAPGTTPPANPMVPAPNTMMPGGVPGGIAPAPTGMPPAQPVAGAPAGPTAYPSNAGQPAAYPQILNGPQGPVQ